MKILLALAITATFAIQISFVHAKTLSGPDPLTVQEQVKRKVAFESFARKFHLEGKVEVTFTIDELHMIRIHCITGDSEDMVKYVKKKMDKQEIYGEDILINQPYKISFEYYELGSLGLKPKSIYNRTSHSL